MWHYYYHYYCDNNQRHFHELVSTTNQIMRMEIRLIIYSAQQMLRTAVHRLLHYIQHSQCFPDG